MASKFNKIWSPLVALSSICLIKRLYRVSAKAHLKVPVILHEIIIGSMLGDLTAERPNKNCSTRIQFKQSIINKEYIECMNYSKSFVVQNR